MGLRIYTRTEKPSASKELCTAEGPHQLYWVRIWSAHRMLRTQQFLWRLVPWHSLWGQFLSSYPMLAVQIIATKVNYGLSDSRLWLPGLGPELVHAVAGSSVLSSVSNSTAIPWAPGKHVGHSAWPWSNPLKAFIDFDTSDTFWSFVLNFFLLFFFVCQESKIPLVVLTCPQQILAWRGLAGPVPDWWCWWEMWKAGPIFASIPRWEEKKALCVFISHPFADLLLILSAKQIIKSNDLRSSFW